MKAIMIVIRGTVIENDLEEGSEEQGHAEIVILLVEKGVAQPLDKKVRLVVVRDDKLVII